uniref:Tetraspanin n=1 Tax=Neolamprologus brichardi TaxID=32507 RepID=A0A3Q4HI04_NEOBR
MDCGVAKIILLFISLIFWAAGAGMAYVGHYVIKSFGSFDSLIQNKSTLIPAAIIIGISAVMFFVGIVGCCSTLRESKCGLGFFFLIIMLIFAAEVTALVFSFIYRGKFPFAHDPFLFDFLQLKCCGVKNYTDWTNTTYFSTNKTLPLSCCKNSSSPQCNGKLEEWQQFNTEGCEPNLEKFIQDVLTYAMLVVVAFAIIKFFGMVSVCAITCKSRRSGYEPLYA